MSRGGERLIDVSHSDQRYHLSRPNDTFIKKLYTHLSSAGHFYRSLCQDILILDTLRHLWTLLGTSVARYLTTHLDSFEHLQLLLDTSNHL